ncbi:MAG: tetratricopeptide repeat protein [SAR324 cluster bacterium]|nr:tetratricopeptide repeat protein [SAR324 cluster bacterium]
MAMLEKERAFHPAAQSQWNAALRNFAKKLYNRAMLNIREAIRKDPLYLEEAHIQINSYFRTGQPEKAVAIGLAIIVFEPENFRLMNQIGNAYRKMENYKKALQMYQGALKVNPKYAHARYNMAAAYFKVPKMDEELVRQTKFVEKFVIYRRTGYQLTYDEAVPKLGNQVMPKHFRYDSEIPYKEEDVEGAEIWISRFEKRAKDNPDSWQHQFDLAILYDIGRFGELALRYYQESAALNPLCDLIQNNLAVAIAEYRQDFKKAKEMFLSILKKDRSNRTIVLNLAILHRKMNKPFSMLKYFTYLGELLAKSHGLFSLDDMIQAAEEYYEEGEHNKAIKLYEALLDEKDDPEWMYRLGVLYHRKLKLKSAIAYWKQALEADPDHTASFEALNEQIDNLEDEAQQLLDENFLLDAASLLELATSIYPRVSTYELLADIHEELGEKDLADQAALRIRELAENEKVA